ncbi:MAG: hypothetical protein V4584_08415 [Verrucomicrobiota bacterium]
MKPSSIKSLLLASALFAPPLPAQDGSGKVREIEQKVLRKQYLTGIDALVGSARDEKAPDPQAIGKRLQWLTLVSTQIDGENKTPAADPEEIAKSALELNDLAWKMITSPAANNRHPEIALKLADMAIGLGGENAELKPAALDTRARALFLLGKHAEAIEGQETAVAAATLPEQKALLEATLAAYRKNELPEVGQEAARLSGTAYIADKLNRLIIPRIDFEDTTVEEAIEFLRLRAVELDTTEPDPAKKGINLVIRRPRRVPAGAADAGTAPATPTAEAGVPDAASDPGTLRVKELRIRNVPLSIALKYICDQTKLRMKVDDFAVTLVTQSEMEKDIFTCTFNVPPDFASILDSGSDADKAPAAPSARRPLIELLKSNGIHFGDGTSATMSTSGMLLVTNNPSELDKIEQLIEAMTVRSKWTRKQAPASAAMAEEKPGVEATPAASPKVQLPKESSPTGEGEASNTYGAPAISDGVARVVEKLKTIVIPVIDFENATLEEAVDYLRKQAIELDTAEPDPSRKGLNFVVRQPRPASGENPANPAADSDQLRIPSLHLRNVPLAVALKYICDVTRCRYKVDDFAVTLVPLSEADKDLFTRTFRVPLDFASKLSAGSGVKPAPGDPAPSFPIIELLKSNGINFGEGSSVTLTDNGTLLITNTPTELDKLEQLIQAMMPLGR